MLIAFKNNDFLVINKPVGMPSQPDPTGDVDAISATAEHLRASGERDDLWLVHRLDRGVGGLMVLARSKRAAAALSELVSGEGLKKDYMAICRGESSGGRMTDLLFKDSAKGKSFVVDRERQGVKKAELTATPLSVKTVGESLMTLLSVKLLTGRFHQIRAQLSSRKTPLVGDKKYGDSDRRAKFPTLFSYKVSFELFGKSYEVSARPNTEAYPWCEFKEEIEAFLEKGSII